MNSNPSRKFYTKLTGTAFLFKVSGSFLLYFSLIILARAMNLNHFGEFAYINSWLTILALIAGAGIPAYSNIIVPRMISKNAKKRFWSFIYSSYWINIITSIITGAVVLLILNFLGVLNVNWLICLILIPIYSIMNLQIYYGRIINKIVTAQFIDNIVRPLSIIFISFFSIQYSFELLPWHVFMALTVSITASLLFQKNIIFKSFKVKVVKEYSIRFFPYIKSSFVYLLIGSSIYLLEQTDIIVLGAIEEKKDVALYFTASKTSALISFVYYSFLTTLTPIISKLHSQKNTNELQSLMVKASKYMLISTFSLAAFTVIFHKFLLGLFGKEYVSLQIPLVILALSHVVMSLMGICDGYNVTTGLQRQSFKIYMISFFINLSLNLALIPLWGINGAALATLIAKCFLSINTIFLAKKYAQHRVIFFV